MLLNFLKKRSLSLIDEGRFPHAILVKSTSIEIGLEYVFECAKRLLKSDNPFFSVDCNIVKPEGKIYEIKIEKIRDVIDFAIKSPKISDKKLIVIQNAEFLNKNAANALLKILEEPPIDTFFFLLSEINALIFPTVKSRCCPLVIDDTLPFQIPDKLQDVIQEIQLRVPLFLQQLDSSTAILQLYAIISILDKKIKSLGDDFSRKDQEIILSTINDIIVESLRNDLLSRLSDMEIFLKKIQQAKDLAKFNVNFLTILEFIFLNRILD